MVPSLFVWLARQRRRLITATNVFSAQFSDGRPAASPDGTAILAGVGGRIIDSRGNVWRLTPGRQVALNGITDRSTRDVLELAYVNARVWQQNSVGLWWSRTADMAWLPYSGSRISPFLKSRPAPVLSLQVVTVTASAITLHWDKPESGALPFVYSVQLRAVGTPDWVEAAHTTNTSALLSGLAPATTYKIEVLATNC